jgi:hypothetical protein
MERIVGRNVAVGRGVVYGPGGKNVLELSYVSLCVEVEKNLPWVFA